MSTHQIDLLCLIMPYFEYWSVKADGGYYIDRRHVVCIRGPLGACCGHVDDSFGKADIVRRSQGTRDQPSLLV